MTPISSAPPDPIVSSGDNYRLSKVSGTLLLEVWQRPDLSSQQGADLAERMLAEVRAHTIKPDVREVILDLSKAPPVAGPRTQAALADIAGFVCRHGKPFAFVSGERALMRMQLKRLLADKQVSLARIVRTLAEL